MVRNLFFGAVLSLSTALVAQAQQTPATVVPGAHDTLSPGLSWWQKCIENDNISGTSSERAYIELLQNVPIQEVVVAVIDGGTDIEHEDLRNRLWTNPGEIPGDGIDNDGNGYVDDIHGWSFISGPGGEIIGENLEWVREFRRLSEKKGMRLALTTEEKAQLKTYKKRWKKEQKSARKGLQKMQEFKDTWDAFEAYCGEDFSAEKAAEYAATVKDEDLQGLYESVARAIENEMELWLIKDEVLGGYDHYYNQLNYHLNLEYNPRAMVGDDPYDTEDRYYGDNRVYGPRAEHGTHVAGIIGAERNNGIGMNGMAVNARIMVLRVVPDGDERDKDVANAIRYAVDNGAKVVNMSFGKAVPTHQEYIEEAIIYALKNDVLLVHAAGNESKNLDEEVNYPNGLNEELNLRYPNWIEVGASKYGNTDQMVANFSNYGKESVDLFAPGYDIYSTMPESRYKENSGTSMAAPVVAGTATLLRGLRPDLSAEQIKRLLMLTTLDIDDEVNLPGSDDETIPFGDLSISGGLLNFYKAVNVALQE